MKQKAPRSGAWKLWVNQTDTALLNLDTDRGEQHNIAELEPGIRRQLETALMEWEQSVDNHNL